MGRRQCRAVTQTAQTHIPTPKGGCARTAASRGSVLVEVFVVVVEQLFILFKQLLLLRLTLEKKFVNFRW